MKSLLFVAPKSLEIVEKQVRSIKDDELLIQIGACGVCGTDLHIFNGEASAKLNTVLGHEFSGTIVEKGKGCSEFSIGEKIAVDPNIYCGKCSYCKNGQIHFCKNHRALGVTEDGGFSEYTIVPLSQAYHLPKDISLNLAAFAEPLSCCLRGIDRSEIKAGENVIIIGGGSIGLIMLQLSAISGAARLIMIEPNEERRILAQRLGAQFVFSPDDENLLQKIKELTNGSSGTIIECVGNSSAAALSIQISNKGSKVILFGLAPFNESIKLNLQEIFKKELTIKSSFLNPFTFDRAVELIINNKLQLERFPVSLLSLEEIQETISSKVKKSKSLKYQFNNQNNRRTYD